MYWNRENLVLQVFKGIPCLEHDFTFYYKIFVCDTDFVAVLAQKLLDLPEILYLIASKYKLMLIRFWCILLKRFRYCSKFSRS